jgi:hypothetical protein
MDDEATAIKDFSAQAASPTLGDIFKQIEK